MDPRKEAEEKLSLLEGKERKIKDTEIRARILTLYTEMIRDLATNTRDMSLSIDDKQRYLDARVVLFRQSASTVMGEDEMHHLFGHNQCFLY